MKKIQCCKKSVFTILMMAFAPIMQAQEKLVESVVAVVNEKPILLSEFEQAWEIQKKNLKGNISDEQALKKRLVEHLIMLRLQKQSAEKNGIRVNERELNASIDMIARRNNLSLKDLYTQAAQQGVSLQEFRDNIRQQLITQRLQSQLFAGRIQVSEIEIDEVIAQDRLFNDPMEYQFKTLLIKPKENTQQAWKASKEEISEIQQSINNGQSFDEAIALHSDNNNGFNDASLRWQDASSIPELFHKSLVKLPKNSISEPIKAGRGYFLLQLVDKQFKRKVQALQYKLEQISLPIGSYDEQQVIALEAIIQQSLKEEPQSFSTLAREYSKDHYAPTGGMTDWLKPQDIEPAIIAQLTHQKINNTLHKALTQQGWTFFRLVDKKKYDASEEVTREEIKQRLSFNKIQAEYQEFLRNLRLRAAIQINL